ncbi:holo-ACP synthase [Novosphingobium sp. FSY-8]|uniref:Holo-[acyl-carrier-protein] synthase n=1 Tax=Novosphingobium ovatum TaxID=1908523 RepID=A0ABW9XD70_9SPHN|nr:holo-ACP synthase [Novosphingobium ovatum]NBC36468.1 holo-ACP synthase [Novosphingobium ovatum]
MIIGIGSDLCGVDRIAAALARSDRFAARVFTAAEVALADSRPALRAATLAKRWAAKEACAKALGTGIAQGVAMNDIEVITGPHGAPALCLHGGAAARLAALTPAGHTARLHLTLSDEPPHALAFVVIEAVAA